ncbi:MAG: helix-turn-helix transcriptional regulator, partial [Bacteroidia bacterium]
MHNNLRFFRMAQNLKQKTIADLLKMSQPNYSNLENGKTKLTSDTAEKLAGYFRVSQDALLNQKQLLTNQIGGEFQIDNNTAQYFETNKEFFDPILARMEILLNLLADEKEELAIERMQLTEVFDKLAN